MGKKGFVEDEWIVKRKGEDGRGGERIGRKERFRGRRVDCKKEQRGWERKNRLLIEKRTDKGWKRQRSI